jgi:5,10-methenyltetrahydrofolate synthetase
VTLILPSAGDDVASRRRVLRAHAIAEREALTATRRAALMRPLEAHLTRLIAHLAPQRLAFCWPWRGEPDLRAWVTRWMAADAAREALLPVVLDKATPLVFRRWTAGMEMPFDRHGIPHPPAGEFIVPEVVLVPCNAFDGAGYRLGYGGGYFDRTLAVIEPVAVGIGFELGRAATVYPQAHDRPMQWIVTEAGAAPGDAGG